MLDDRHNGQDLGLVSRATPPKPPPLVPVIKAFQFRHELGDTPMIIAADAGMVSASNLTALDDAGLRFIVGSRSVEAPIDLASHFHWNADVFTDGQIVDTVTPRHAKSVVNDSAHRAGRSGTPTSTPTRGVRSVRLSQTSPRDQKTLYAQETRACAVSR